MLAFAFQSLVGTSGPVPGILGVWRTGRLSSDLLCEEWPSGVAFWCFHHCALSMTLGAYTNL